jgi:type I restriction enzyme S subunit
MKSEELKTNNQTWRKVNLGEILKEPPQYGYTASAIDKKMGPKFLRVTDIVGYKVDWAKVPFCKISEKEKKKYLLNKGDIVFARAGTVGYTFFVKENLPEETIFASYLIRIKIDEKRYDPVYVSYFLKSPSYWGQVNNFLTGTSQPGINATLLRDFELLIPEDINEQKRIADILSAFDDKIELNNKIIKTLEEMAQEVFKQWFIKFRFPGWEKVKFVDSELGKIPEGWEIKQFEEIMKFLNGKNPDNAIFNQSGKYYIYGSNTIMGKSDKFLYEGPIVILARIGSNCGALRLSIAPCWISNNTTGIKGKNGISTFFIYLLLKNFDFNQIKEGTGQPYINIKALKSYATASPPKYILNIFKEIISNFYLKIQQKVEENQKLAALRDLLLPKLMSGEIRV